jgi:hypothetical protein
VLFRSKPHDIVGNWIEEGVNIMFPLEVNGGTDPVALREKYGQGILLAGGVNKIPLAKGKKEIEQELDYPGTIRVTVIRESRAVEYAK